MKRRGFVSLLAFVSSVGLLSHLQADDKPQEPTEYNIRLVQVADIKPLQVLFQIDKRPNVVYKSLYSPELRVYISFMPKGAKINYYPSCVGPQLFTVKELDDFEAYCKSKDILFPRIMGG